MSTSGLGLDVVTAASDLLQCVVDHYTAAPPLSGVTPLPERRMLLPGAAGEEAWDCEQLTVSLQGIGYGPAVDISQGSARSGTPVGVSAVRHVVLILQLVRCTPVVRDDGTPPPLAEVDAAGRQYLRDAGLLSQATVTFASRLRVGLDRSTESVQTGTVDPVGPNGGFVALETQLAITVANLV